MANKPRTKYVTARTDAGNPVRINLTAKEYDDQGVRLWAASLNGRLLGEIDGREGPWFARPADSNAAPRSPEGMVGSIQDCARWLLGIDQSTPDQAANEFGVLSELLRLR